jgi:IPT/TIG domain
MICGRVRLALLGFLLVLGLAGCGGYGSGPMAMGAVPSISQLSPAAAMHGSATFMMVVTGANFGTDAVVYFNGNPIQTAYGTTTQVSAQVPAADVTAAAMIPVYVRTNGQNSNSMTFTVQ